MLCFIEYKIYVEYFINQYFLPFYIMMEVTMVVLELVLSIAIIVMLVLNRDKNKIQMLELNQKYWLREPPV